jgi:hypothetical protein
MVIEIVIPLGFKNPSIIALSGPALNIRKSILA